jgi:hypothetical protein
LLPRSIFGDAVYNQPGGVADHHPRGQHSLNIFRREDSA